MGEIASYLEKDLFFLLLKKIPMGCSSFGLSLAFPFCLPCDGSGINLLFIYLLIPIDIHIQ